MKTTQSCDFSNSKVQDSKIDKHKSDSINKNRTVEKQGSFNFPEFLAQNSISFYKAPISNTKPSKEITLNSIKEIIFNAGVNHYHFPVKNATTL